jgi:hypothetical protein
MGISGFLAGLARMAGAAAPYVTDTLAAKAQAQAQGEAQRRQELLAMLAMQRQEREAAAREALAGAQTDYYRHRSAAAQRVPVTYKVGDQNEYYALPTSIVPSDLAATAAQNGPSPSPIDDHTPIPSPMLERLRDSRGAGISTGVPTGVHAPPQRQPVPRSATGMVHGRAVVGTVSPSGAFTPDTTASGDTIFAVPRAGRSGGSANDPLATQLNHTINNVRAQLADTERQMGGLQRTIQAGTGPLATDDARKAAAAAQALRQKLQARADSLRAVHDQLIQRQQERIGGIVSGHHPSAGRATSSIPYALAPNQTAAMQSEFDAASQDLQTLLNSNAPPEIKARARALYDAHQRDVARKYGATGGRP